MRMMISSKLGFGRRFQIAIVLIMVVIVLVSVMTIQNLNSSREDLLEIVENRYKKVNYTYEIEKNVSSSKMLVGSIANDLSGVTSATIQDKLAKNHVKIEEHFAKIHGMTLNEKAREILMDCASLYRIYKENERIIIMELIQDNEYVSKNWEIMEESSSKLTESIEEFISYQEEMMEGAFKRASEKYNHLCQVVFLLTITSCGLIGLIGYWVIRSTTKDLNQITTVLKEIDLNDPSTLHRLEVKTDDEIGLIAEAFNNMSVSLEIYNKNEKAYLKDIKIQNWVLSKINEIISLTQSVFDINEFADRLQGKLSPLVGASIGALYLRGQADETCFYRAASYGDGGKDQFKVGEGIIGQAAIDQKIVLLEDIPEDYQLLSTGLCEAKPKAFLIVPIIYENNTIGILEFASITGFSDIQYQAIQQVNESLGLAIHSVLNRMEIECLLNESKAMTEELQVQTEELHSQSEELMTINELLEEREQEAIQKTKELEQSQEELRIKNEQLMQSSNYKSEFLANISHELRTPLNSILILAEMLIDVDSDCFSAEEKEYIEYIYSAANSLTSLINDILDLSKIEAGKSEITYSKMNISELVETLNIFSPQAERKQLGFTIEIDENLPSYFYTDVQKIQQIVKNLLSNAIKFTERGKVSVKVEKIIHTCDEKDNHNTTQTDEWIKIVVMDTGIGIHKDKQQTIFEAFQQGDGSTVQKYGGTGLGLSICKKLSYLLNGHIFVESEVGKGSTFTLYIPYLQNQENINVNQGDQYHQMIAEVAAAKEPNDIQLDILHGKRVLITDDDQRNIYSLKAILEKKKMEVLVAHNGIECLEILKKDCQIDMILMDIMMPELNGYETMKRIRQNSEFASLPIIALTAKGMKGDREKCLAAGASDYISKPINLEQLISVMRVWMN